VLKVIYIDSVELQLSNQVNALGMLCEEEMFGLRFINRLSGHCEDRLVTARQKGCIPCIRTVVEIRISNTFYVFCILLANQTYFVFQ